MLSQKFTKEFWNEEIPSQVRASAVKAAAIATIQIKEDRAKYTKGITGKLRKELPGFKPASLFIFSRRSRKRPSIPAGPT